MLDVIVATKYRGRTLCSALTRRERGSVSVLVALILPMLILFLSLVVDLGNAFNHHRHLQLQADAAALAGGEELGAGSCVDSNVVGRALQYSNVNPNNTNGWAGAATFTPTYNAQIGGTSSNLWEALNSTSYLPSGNTAPSDPTSPTGSPCAKQALDVKVTEPMSQWYFNAFGLFYLNAHARVENRVIGSGFLPFAVQETAPRSVGAYFVDESTGSVLTGPVPLQSSGPIGGTGTYAADNVWTATSVSVPVTVKDIGMILVLSGTLNDYKCGDPLVVCENQGPVTQAAGSAPVDYLTHIQGYVKQPGTPAGSLTKPIPRQVTMSAPVDGTGCGSAVGLDGYFSTATTSCNVTVNATLDLGTNANPTGAIVEAAITGTKTGYALTYASGAWSGTVPIAPGSGGNGIDLWVCSANPCNSKTAVIVPHVQATFAATQASAKNLDGMKITDATTGLEQNSYPMCSTCAASLNITADVTGTIQDATSVNSPLFSLNFGSSNTTSTTGTVECPPGSNSATVLAAAINSGCQGQFAINNSDPGCAYGWPGPGPSPGGANGLGPPADCVQTKNGLAGGQVDTAIYNRFVNASGGGKWYCPNNWSSFDPTKPYDNLPSDDDRIITLFITPLGTFAGSGNTFYPIQDAAYFYVIGWSGGQGGGTKNADPCATDPPAPASSPGARFWGYFIRYSDPNAVAGTQSCSVSGLGACTVALTQ